MTVTEWFEDEEFVATVIRLGLGRLSQENTNNNRGILEYVMDKAYVEDARVIALLVREHNSVHST